jgi:hypothetical protein
MFFPTFLTAYSLIASSYDNDFVLSFSIERIKRWFTLHSRTGRSKFVFLCNVSLGNLLSSPRNVEEVRTYEGPWNLNFISLTVNRLLQHALFIVLFFFSRLERFWVLLAQSDYTLSYEKHLLCPLGAWNLIKTRSKKITERRFSPPV